MMPSTYMACLLTLSRQHLAALTHAVPSLPAGFERAGAVLMRDFERHGLIGVLLLIAGFVVLGFGGEQLYYRAAAGVARWIVALPLASVGERLGAVAVRLAYATGMVAAFALRRVGPFLAFDWPPLLPPVVLGYLHAFYAFR